MGENVVAFKLLQGGGKMTKDEKPSTNEPILQWFAYGHLPERLREVSKPFGDMALEIVMSLPKNEERDMCLRKLLEAKDCAVRAQLSVTGF